MSDAKKTPACAATQTEASVGDFDFLPACHSTTVQSVGQLKISDVLGRGQENALPLSYLATVFHCDRRAIRRRIRQEREAGAPICVDNATGYFLAASQSERDRCARAMRRRAVEVWKTAEFIGRAKV